MPADSAPPPAHAPRNLPVRSASGALPREIWSYARSRAEPRGTLKAVASAADRSVPLMLIFALSNGSSTAAATDVAPRAQPTLVLNGLACRSLYGCIK
eukprot:514334-Prymnesium_polylepis.3